MWRRDFLDAEIDAQCDVVQALCDRQPRVMVAIAGPPGTGKSTFAEKMSRALFHRRIRNSIVPMDGFHLDNAVLDEMGLRHRKGAPETFDAEGFVALLTRIAEPRGDVYVPVFDRAADLSRNAARTVRAEAKVVLIEGNYLLLDYAPWCRIAGLFDHTITLTAKLEVLRDRLLNRWRKHGYTDEEARRKAEENDLPNARYVLENSRPSSRTIVTG